MTNKKLKSRNLAGNMLLSSVSADNTRILCKLIIALRHSGFGVERLKKLVREYADGRVKEFEKLSGEDMQNITVQRQLNLNRMSLDELVSFVQTQNISQYSTRIQTTIAENVGIFFLQLNDSFGFGRTRFMRLLEYAKTYTGDATKEVEEMLDLTFSNGLPDADDYKGKPYKMSREEFDRVRRDLEGLRAFQERNNNEHNTKS